MRNNCPSLPTLYFATFDVTALKLINSETRFTCVRQASSLLIREIAMHHTLHIFNLQPTSESVQGSEQCFRSPRGKTSWQHRCVG